MDNINNRPVALPITTEWILGPWYWYGPCPTYFWLCNLVIDLLLVKPWMTLTRCHKNEPET